MSKFKKLFIHIERNNYNKHFYNELFDFNTPLNELSFSTITERWKKLNCLDNTLNEFEQDDLAYLYEMIVRHMLKNKINDTTLLSLIDKIYKKIPFRCLIEKDINVQELFNVLDNCDSIEKIIDNVPLKNHEHKDNLINLKMELLSEILLQTYLSQFRDEDDILLDIYYQDMLFDNTKGYIKIYKTPVVIDSFKINNDTCEKINIHIDNFYKDKDSYFIKTPNNSKIDIEALFSSLKIIIKTPIKSNSNNDTSSFEEYESIPFKVNKELNNRIDIELDMTKPCKKPGKTINGYIGIDYNNKESIHSINFIATWIEYKPFKY